MSDTNYARLLFPEITSEIIGAFYHVYNGLGYGFLESIYARGIHIELEKRGLQVDRQYPIPVIFEGEQLGFHRCDMLVNRRIILELKASETLSDAPRKQLRSYLAGAETGAWHAAPFRSQGKLLSNPWSSCEKQ